MVISPTRIVTIAIFLYRYLRLLLLLFYDQTRLLSNIYDTTNTR